MLKYELEQTVWFMDQNSIKQGKIAGRQYTDKITACIHWANEKKYFLIGVHGMEYVRLENELFPTKEALIASL